MTTFDREAAANSPLPAWLIAVLRLFIIISLPLVLIMLNARMLMTDAFLRFEYGLPNFPADTEVPIGGTAMTQAERYEYAQLALDYLLNDAGIEFLGEQTFPDGQPLYNSRELSHMLDVKIVTQDLMVFGYSWIALVVIAAVVLGWNNATRSALYRALLSGGIVTALLILSGLVAVATSFNWLFTEFHNLFFAEGTWVFLYTDTLIRLFPIVFWTHAFALIFIGALLEAAILGGLSWWLLRSGRKTD